MIACIDILLKKLFIAIIYGVPYSDRDSHFIGDLWISCLNIYMLGTWMTLET